MKSSDRAISELPSFPLVSDQICIIGNVTIHPNTAIAPGVVIQAASDSQVIIEEGACIGMGVVINADQGKIVIEQRAVLGARVLMIGKGIIGKNACIGAGTTIFNSSVESMTVINAYSIIGDSSRFLNTEIREDETINDQLSDQLNEELNDPWNDPLNEELNPLNDLLKKPPESEQSEKPEPINPVEKLEVPPQEMEEVLIKNESSFVPEVESERIKVSEILTEHLEKENPSPSQKSPVVGQVYINNLLLTLFPNRQSINIPSAEDEE